MTKSLVREIDEVKRENEGLLQQIHELEMKVAQISTNQVEKHRVDQLEQLVAYEQRKRAEAEKKSEEVKTTNAELLQSCQDELHKSQKEVYLHKKNILRQQQGIARYKSKSELELNRIENVLQRTKETLQKKDEELDGCKTRLSRLMGDKLSNCNPDITDRSDKNRPTKLAERYQDIYDIEWTDAYEILDNGNEEKTIACLINILQGAWKFCDEEAEKQMVEIQNALTPGMSTVMGISGIPSDVKKLLNDCRKSLADDSKRLMHERYYKTLERTRSQTATNALLVPEFLEACVHICWLMAVQDPPLVIGPFTQSGVDFDTNVYKVYTKIGKK